MAEGMTLTGSTVNELPVEIISTLEELGDLLLHPHAQRGDVKILNSAQARELIPQKSHTVRKDK